MRRVTQQIVDEAVRELPQFHTARGVLLQLWLQHEQLELKKPVAWIMFFLGIILGSGICSHFCGG